MLRYPGSASLATNSGMDLSASAVGLDRRHALARDHFPRFGFLEEE
jgi:hypothetical protein